MQELRNVPPLRLAHQVMPARPLWQEWPLKLPLPFLWKRHAAPLDMMQFLR